MEKITEDILELQKAIHKSQKIAKKIHGYVSGSRLNENVRVLKNYLEKAEEKLNDIYKLLR